VKRVLNYIWNDAIPYFTLGVLIAYILWHGIQIEFYIQGLKDYLF